MSRNFELLQKIGREQAIYSSPVEEAVLPEVDNAPVAVPTGSRLEIEGAELEEFTKLVQRVFLLPGSDAPRMVVMAGTEPGNGCSWVTARVAEVLTSQITGSVCLVDANLRHPSLHEQFEVQNHYGLTDSLQKREPMRSFAQAVSRPNLWLISGGSATEDSQSILSSDRMRLRMAELRAEFDYVVIDAPAISNCNDATVLGCNADGLVLVLKANSSRRESARKAMQDLRSAKARVLGAVLNQRTFPIPQSIYNKL